MPPRDVTHRYGDPLDRIWLATAERLGLHVVRSDAAYASTDGRGTLTVGTPETLDADDCLAQIVLHELCHALVQGEASFSVADWGLDNETERDLDREWACHRVQASLAGRYGLRRLLAPTTLHRAFYDALPADPLAGEPGDPSIALARAALARAALAPWREALHEALAATAEIVALARPFAAAGDLLALGPAARPRRPDGLPPGPAAETCASCGWRYGKTGGDRCRVAQRPTDAGAPACLYWEPPLDCDRCGACCRDAYDVVELGPREPVLRRHPALVVIQGGRPTLPRAEGRCVALAEEEGRFRCTIYEDRPRTCRDFAKGGAHCLDARRRLGLSRRSDALPDHHRQHRQPE